MNSKIPINVLYTGSPDELPDPLPLRAGPLQMFYENGCLRRVNVAGEELLLMVYAAVRDANWGTVPGVLTETRRQVREESFHIEYESVHQEGDIHFTWRGLLTGNPQGVVTFRMVGKALSTFRRNRIGFCVLHPMTLAGRPCKVEHTDGSTEKGVFPAFISPQQPFLDIRAITCETVSGAAVEVRMEGETFEMEDQRNWTDASYKTYCTPLARPFPVMVEAGTEITQTVTLRLLAAANAAKTPAQVEAAERGVVFNLLSESRPLPPIGLCSPNQRSLLSNREVKRLKVLGLSHLRAEIDFRKVGADLRVRPLCVRPQLQAACEDSQALGVPLELALHLTASAETELAALCAALDELQPRLARWLVFQAGEKVTGAKRVQMTRRALEKYAAPIGAGTDAYFTEINRIHPPLEDADFVVYSANPQVHAFDTASLVENLAGLGATVQSARRLCGEKPLLVGPVTLRRRWNPDASGPEPDPAPGELPYQVDPRQMSLFGAGWTAGSLKYLAESGADILTYYETVGWRGVMESDAGSPLPAKFSSIPGGVFPLYHVFADLAEFAGSQVVTCRSSDPRTLDGLVLKKGSLYRALAANFTGQHLAVSFPDIGGRARVRVLDASNAEQAMTDPEGFRLAAVPEIAAGQAGLHLDLPPFSLARLDWS